MLQSMRMMVERGPSESRTHFFDVVRAMLFYIDEFPERLHHPKESNLLFPKVVKAAPQVLGAIDRLERDHMVSEKAARELQHLLLSWELLGSSRRAAFEEALKKYVDFYLDHMNLEESIVLPEAERCLTEEDWCLLDAAFAENADPLTGHYPPPAEYEKLFSLIVARAPAPIGLG
jgi:hemerythrin-like domain-containing protein